MYIWTAYGQFVTSGKIKELMPFTEEFELEEGDKPKARSIVHRMIDDRLRKKEKSFYRTHTCQLEDTPKTAEKSGKTNAELEKLMVEAVELGCVPAVYGTLGDDKLRIESLKEAIKKKHAKLQKLNKEKSNVEDQGWV